MSKAIVNSPNSFTQSIVDKIYNHEGVKFKISKATLTIRINIILLLFSFIWGSLFYILGYKIQSIAPFLYFIISILSFAVFFLWLKQYTLYLHFQIGILMLAPAATQVLMGSIYDGALILLWSTAAVIIGLFVLESIFTKVFWLIMCVVILIAIYITNDITLHYLQNNFGTGFDSPYAVLLLMNFIIMIGMCLALLYFQARSLLSKGESIQELLFEIFPAPIAQELMTDYNKTIMKKHARVTIIFIKFLFDEEDRQKSNFSSILNFIFSALDNRADSVGVYKIKTVSETYIAGSGLFNQENVPGLVELARYALYILQYFKKEHNKTLNCKIGINSGELVGGMVGKIKRTYDVWGDTVNVSSRMADTQYTNKIIVSESTKAILNKIDLPYSVQYLDTVPVRGKGNMDINTIHFKETK